MSSTTLEKILDEITTSETIPTNDEELLVLDGGSQSRRSVATSFLKKLFEERRVDEGRLDAEERGHFELDEVDENGSDENGDGRATSGTGHDFEYFR